MPDRLHPWTALTNGLKRRCPHCGQGPLLDGWLTVRNRCPACGILYERSPGDAWAFWILGDRIPVFVGIAAVYFGVAPKSWHEGVLFIAAIAGVLVATIPQRLGVVTALDYLSRRYWPDPADAIPPLPPHLQ